MSKARHGVCVGDKFKTFNYGDLEITDLQAGNSFEVKFYESGSVRGGISLSALRAGHVRDYSQLNKNSIEYQYPLGARYKSDNHGWAEIVEVKHSQRIGVKFDNTGNIGYFQGGSIRRGTFADDMTTAVIPKESYVYGAFVDDVCVYVGKGKGHRYKHCSSGTSSSFGLNKLFFEGKEIKTFIFYEGMYDKLAGELEVAYVTALKPICNTNLMPDSTDAFGRFRPSLARIAYFDDIASKVNQLI